MKKWKIGLIGCGWIAKVWYIPEIMKFPNGEITALCDVNLENAKKLAREYGISQCYADVDEFLEKSDVEIVLSIAAIKGRHEINMKCLKAGKHLYSQKPFALTVEEATEQIQEAEKRGLKLAVAPVHRNRPDRKAAKALIEQGAIGHVSLMKINCAHGGPEYYQYRDSDPTWFYQSGAGALQDLAVHGIDQCVYLLGPAKYVSCTAACSEPERIVRSGAFDGKVIESNRIPDNYIITLDFGNGTLAVITCGYVQKATRSSQGFEIFGNRGTIFVGDPKPSTGIAEVELYVDKPEEGIRGWINPMPLKEAPPAKYIHSMCVSDLISAIEQNREPELTARMGRHVIEILGKIPQAVSEGRRIELETEF